MARTYGYLQYTPRPRRTHCKHCGTKMLPSSGDPRDKKLLCTSRECRDEQARLAGWTHDELSPYGAACERGHCL